MEYFELRGSKLAYERRGRGLPLLLVHGFPEDHTFWQPLAAHLEADFDLIIPDLPGFGLSDLFGGQLSLVEMADCLAALLTGLNTKAVYLAGHSMGGYVCLAFARKYPERVLGLGLFGSQAAPDSPERQAARYAQAEKVAVNGPQEVVGMAEKLSADISLAPFFQKIILRQSSQGIIMVLKAMAARPDATGYLAGFNFPVTFVHGQSDVLIPIDRSREMKQLLPSAVLLELPGVGHASPVEAPVESAQALLGLLKSH